MIVPYPSVKNLLVQKYLGEKRAPWMTTLQEYDLEIKPSMVVKGQGLCKLAAEATHFPNNNSETVIDELLLNREINFVTRFILSFLEIIRPLQKMIKKDAIFNWGQTEKEYFLENFRSHFRIS